MLFRSPGIPRGFVVGADIKNPRAEPEGHDVENKTVMHRLGRLREMVSEAAGVGAWGRTFQVWALVSLGHLRRCRWSVDGSDEQMVQMNSQCPN